MKVIKTPHHNLVFAEISDSSQDFDTVFFRTDINEPPQPSVRLEQTLKTILEIRKNQKKDANIICTSHSSKLNGSLRENFDVLKEELRKEMDPISPELDSIEFVNSLDELVEANDRCKGSLIFLDNVRRTVEEELNPPLESSHTDLWGYLEGMAKIHGALPCCHRDNLSLRVFSDGCYCNEFFIRELEDVTNLYQNERRDIKIWGIGGVKAEKLDAIYLTKSRDELLVALDGGVIFLLMLWALRKEAKSLKRILPSEIGKENRSLIEKYYGKKWDKVKGHVLRVAKSVEDGTIKIILPLDIIVEEKGKTSVVDLSDISKGKFVSVGPNTVTMIGNITAKRIFLQNGSMEPRDYLEKTRESATFLLMREVLKNAQKVFLNGGDTVADVRTLENELKLDSYRKKGKLSELAIGGFVVNWWNYLKGGEMPYGIKYAAIGSLKSLYTEFNLKKGFR